MITLKAISNKATWLANRLEENDGELPPDLESELVITEENLSDKIDAYVKIIRSLEAKACLCEKASLFEKEKKETTEKKIAWLKQQLEFAHKAFDRPVLEGNQHKSRMQKYADTLIIDETLLAPCLKVEKTTSSPDRVRIRKELEQGAVIEGARLEPNFRVRIVD